METVSEYPPISVVVTTYFPYGPDGIQRLKVAEKTLDSWDKWLGYRGSLPLILADDGSPESYQSFLTKHWTDEFIYSCQQDRRGVGASLNAGFARAFEISPLVFYGVDDWSLTQFFDLTPWAQLLLERFDVGMVRLGPPHPNIRGHVEAFTTHIQGWGLRLDRYGFAFAHRPALYHKRMIDHYGWFAKDQSSLECERIYSEKFNADSGGPDVVLALPSPFEHLDSVELAYIDPRKES